MIVRGVTGADQRVAWDGPRIDRLLEGMGLPNSVNASLGLTSRALRIGAVACAVRLVSETPACFPLRAYVGDGLQRQPVYDHAAARLFQDPTPGHGAGGVSSFDLWSDLAASIETEAAGVLWKVKSASGEVAELWPLDPGYFTVQNDGRQRKVIGKGLDGRNRDVTSDVVFVRGWSPFPSVHGISPLLLHDRSFRWAAAYEEYRGRYFEQDGSVNQVIENAPAQASQREDMAKGWAMAVGGPRNAGRIGMLWGGATLKPLGASLVDAQAAELSITIAQDVARIFGIYPAGPIYAMLQAERAQTVELTSTLFHRFTLLKRERRVERALAVDRDLFPDPSAYPRFDSSEFVRGDLATIATVAHELVQDGTINRDEARALSLGLPPIPGGAGEIFLETPVGAGAGNIGPGANQNGSTAEAVKHLTPVQRLALLRSLQGAPDDTDDEA